MSQEEHMEAPNPFSQNAYTEPTSNAPERSDSLSFKGSFWENPSEQIQRNTSAYDDDHDGAYQACDDQSNTDTQQSGGQNPISALLSTIKNKASGTQSNANAHTNNDLHENLYSDANDNNEWIGEEQQPSNRRAAPASNGVTSSHEELNKKEAYLDRKEKQLLERKKRLEAVQHELNTANVRRDNWPCSYYPITFHSIQQEIPPHARGHMKRMYTLVLLTFLCFVCNAFAALIIYFYSIQDASDSNILLAVLYLFCGICGAWRLWYRQIYYAIRDRKTIKWWIFFLFFSMHVGFCIVMSIGIKNWGSAGVVTMIDAFQQRKPFPGFLCLVCSCLWGVLALGSSFYLKKSWTLFKQRGGMEETRGVLAAAAAQHAAEQLV